MKQEIVPIYVMGAGHSGTGILYRMLALHPGLGWFSQFSHRDGGIAGRRKVPFDRTLDRTLRAISTHDWRKKHSGFRQVMIPRPKEAHQIWGTIFPRSGGAHVHAVEEVRALIARETTTWRKQHFIAKLPRLYKHVGALYEAFPQSRFVHIIRDGRAVALSHRYKPRKAEREGELAQKSLQEGADFWADVIDAMSALPQDAKLYEIRYEELCENVHAHIRDILDFCELPSAGFPFHRIPEHLTVTNPRWFKKATTDELETLEQQLAGRLRRYGYDPLIEVG